MLLSAYLYTSLYSPEILSQSIRDVIILPYDANSASKSGCDRFLGRPDTYKLAPFIDSELGRAYDTLITLFCKRKPFNVLTAFSASSART